MRRLGDIIAGLFIPLGIVLLVIMAVMQYTQARAELEQVKAGDTSAVIK